MYCSRSIVCIDIYIFVGEIAGIHGRRAFAESKSDVENKIFLIQDFGGSIFVDIKRCTIFEQMELGAFGIAQMKVDFGCIDLDSRVTDSANDSTPVGIFTV